VSTRFHCFRISIPKNRMPWIDSLIGVLIGKSNVLELYCVVILGSMLLHTLSSIAISVMKVRYGLFVDGFDWLMKY
jgi:hypothetical protein